MLSVDDNLFSVLEEICLEAGRAIMEIYTSEDFETSFKKDEQNSPLTKADLAANSIINEGLKKSFSIPIVSEEQSDKENREASKTDQYWIIDPLDGTKEFINKRDQFTINIGLMERCKPIAGMMYVPAEDTLYWGSDKAYRKKDGKVQEIKVSEAEVKRAVVSFSHFDTDTEEFLKQFGDIELVQAGSALKICKVAEGSAEIYPRLAPLMEWDTAAGDAILRAAGGRVVNLDGEELKYCKPGFKHSGFICSNNIQYKL